MKQVLDKGYVRLVNVMGSDVTISNAARVSYDKASTSLTSGDEKLISYLARNGHTSPFRHATMQFEVYAPLLVARQWWKYVVGSDHTMDAWNESSRRYITEEPVFYVPNKFEWREAPGNSKQGSGDFIAHHIGAGTRRDLEDHITKSIELYEQALKDGICAEQARLFLPAYGMYVRWYWTASIQSVAHFINQRVAHDAQKEIQDYAAAILEFANEHFPVSIRELCRAE